MTFFVQLMTLHTRLLRPFLHLLLYAVLISCVTPYQPDTKSLPGKALIVDGYITDQPGPYQIRLTYTADFTAAALNYVVEKATVYVTDDKGNRQSFNDLGLGLYQSPVSFQGQAGRTYKLTIQLPDGSRYESLPELIRPVPAIDKVYDEYTEKPVAGTAVFDKGFNIYLDTKDPATPGDYYRWTWTHFEPLVFCEIRTVTTRTSSIDYGYTCCEACWDITRCAGANCINATSDEQINGKTISRQFILRAPYSSTNGYYTEIEQLAISREAYIYYKSIENLTKNNGGIFDAAPATLRGNIVSLTSPGTLVFGFFSAAGAQKTPYTVDRKRGVGKPNVVPQPQIPSPPPLPPCAACLEGGYRTRIKPRWWPF